MSKESEYFWSLMKALGVGAVLLVLVAALALVVTYGIGGLIALTGG